MEDLNHAVDVASMAVGATPQGHPDRAGRLNILGILLYRRFKQTGLIEDLNRGTDIADLAVNATSQDHPDRAGVLNNLGTWLEKRFKRTGSIEDLSRAVEVTKMAVNATPQYHPNRVAILSNLGNRLSRWYEQTGSMEDLNRAVEVVDIVVNAISQDHRNRAGYLSILGQLLGRRFEQTGSIEDLNRAVDVTDMAVNANPQDHPNRAAILNNLGIWLGRRFEQTGSMEDLSRAVDVADMVINATLQDHPDRAGYLTNLGNRLGRRFEQTGSMEDLNRAVDIANIAVNATRQDHPNRAAILNNLGIWLGRRFEQTGSMEDLSRAVDVGDMAVNAPSPEHYNRPGYLNNLGTWLGMRFEQTGSIEDLNRAVDIADTAVNATPQDHSDRAGYLNNLGQLFRRRFEQTESIEDLGRAIDVADMAVNANPQDHPARAGFLNNLGNLLSRRFELTGSMGDLDHALSYFKEGWVCSMAPPSIRIVSAKCAANILASQLLWEQASDLLQDAVKLLPIVSPRLLQNNDKQHVLGQFSGLASTAAAISLEAGIDKRNALELLELGRCIIAGLLLEMRSDLSDLKKQHPTLATEFESLRNELDSPSETAPLNDTTSLWKSQTSQRFEADKRFNEVISEIRNLPGFQNFLLPPSSEELMAAAYQGPLILINVSAYRCDAFLVEHYQIRVVPLPNLSESELSTRVRQHSVGSTSTLQWLWSAAAEPILQALGYHQPPLDDNWPQVWWIPTGVLSHFPIHAAGFHTKGSAETVLDRVMSSYASSIKALVYGRRHAIPRPAESALEHALLIAMQDTPGCSRLPFAPKEVEMLTGLCPSLQLKSVMPSPHRGEVLAHLRACKIFHFAGHGRSDPLDPSQSCLLLEDWKERPLTVGDLRDYWIQESAPFLGYLSACSTSANKVDKLVDEGIHLVSALQLAGFRHVIGTLWEVSDSHCIDVARVFYETIQDERMVDTAVCRGLHRAVKALRDKYVKEVMQSARNAELCDESDETSLESPQYWVPYIHYGV
jgi:Tfp pilus assembly protein PilF